MQRWKCEECGTIINDDQVLSAPHPFRAQESVSGCPHCLSADLLVGVCDEPGCDAEGTCGWPTEDGGYRRTCFKHSCFARS